MKTLLLLLIFPVNLCLSQVLRSPPGQPSIGLGAYSMNFVDPFAFSSNQAALSNLKQISAGVYAEKRYLLKELNLYTIAIGLPTQWGGFGITTRYFGFSDYNESEMGLAYGKNLGKIDIGVQFNYYRIRISGYGSDGTVNVEGGTIWHITERIHAGIHVFNPVGGKFGRNKAEKLSSIFKTGLGYEASDKVFVSTEIVKEENQPINVYVGIQYAFAAQFFLRGGISTVSASPWLGAGLAWKNFRIDISSSYHPQLGITPGMMIIFSGKHKQEE